MMRLKDKIIKKKITVGIIGLGYVGLPLAVRFALAGFDITGIDIDEGKVTKVNQGKPYVPDVRKEEVRNLVSQGKLRATNNYDTLGDLDVLIICVAYKKNVGDIREAPALEVINVLLGKGADLVYNDPYVPRLIIGDKVWHSVQLQDNLLNEMDCVVIITGHSLYDFEWIIQNAKLVIDTRNATRGVTDSTGKIIKL